MPDTTSTIIERTVVQQQTIFTPISWTTLEFEEKDRHPDWIWYAGLVALIVAIISFFLKNIFFGIFAIIAGITVVIYALRKPKELHITIASEGVSINDETIPYKNVRQFWLDETGKQDKLLLLVKSSFVPLLALPLEGVTGDKVRTALTAKEVPEVEMRESTSVALFDRLGF